MLPTRKVSFLKNIQFLVYGVFKAEKCGISPSLHKSVVLGKWSNLKRLFCA